MNKIRFSHLYLKMPAPFHMGDACVTRLLAVAVDEVSNLPKEFLDWDTAYEEQSWVSSANKEKITKLGYYELPKGKVLILFLFTTSENNHAIWSTIRRWTPDKENYYRNLIGQEFKIEVGT